MAIRYYMVINDRRTIENPLAIFRVVDKGKGFQRYQAYKEGIGWQNTHKSFLRMLLDGDPGLHEVTEKDVKNVLVARSSDEKSEGTKIGAQ